MRVTFNPKARFYQLSGDADMPLPPSAEPLAQFGWINDKLFLHVSTSGETVQTVIEQGVKDNVKICLDEKGGVFVPVDWLKERFPFFSELYRLLGEHAEKVRYSEQ